MNGRVYDPVVGRFVSPDPWIQDATNSQSFNRYTYVWNNPLRYTDPTGERTSFFGRSSIIPVGRSSSSAYLVTRTTETQGWNVTITVAATAVTNSIALLPEAGTNKPKAKEATDHQQKNSIQQTSDAGGTGNTSGNLGSAPPVVSTGTEGDKGTVESTERRKKVVLSRERKSLKKVSKFTREGGILNDDAGSVSSPFLSTTTGMVPECCVVSSEESDLSMETTTDIRAFGIPLIHKVEITNTTTFSYGAESGAEGACFSCQPSGITTRTTTNPLDFSNGISSFLDGWGGVANDSINRSKKSNRKK